MKTFFKDEKTIIINSMDRTEALLGKAYIDKLNTNNQTIKVEQRNDINDDFDGFVLTISDKPAPAPLEEKAIRFSILENDLEKIFIQFSAVEEDVTNIITDFDITKLNLLIQYLTDMGVTEIEFSLDGIITGNTNGKYIEGTYTLPAETFTFHQVNSDVSFYNIQMILDFVLTEVTPKPDTVQPIIILKGTTPVEVEFGNIYTDAGATAMDDIDGDITENIEIVSDVDTSITGTYTVKYNVSDSSGNKAQEVIRTVNVVDTSIPVITMLGENNIEVTIDTEYTDAGATATDLYDGDITEQIMVDNQVNINTVGTYNVTYNVTDSNGNKAEEVVRVVNVITTP